MPETTEIFLNGLLWGIMGTMIVVVLFWDAMNK